MNTQINLLSGDELDGVSGGMMQMPGTHQTPVKTAGGALSEQFYEYTMQMTFVDAPCQYVDCLL